MIERLWDHLGRGSAIQVRGHGPTPGSIFQCTERPAQLWTVAAVV